MRLLLRIDTVQNSARDETADPIHERPEIAGPCHDSDAGITSMLALLDSLHASTSAEAFAALRRAFPDSGLDTRVEAVKKRRLHPPKNS